MKGKIRNLVSRTISRPGCRVYVGNPKFPHYRRLGICIIHVSGDLYRKQAQEKGLGGEVLCAIS